MMPVLFFFIVFQGDGQNVLAKDDILNKVNVMIGTGANGAVIPVAIVLNGMFN